MGRAAGPILDELAGAGQSGQVPAVHYQHRLIPYQVVAVISPWNVPLLLAMIDSLAALSAGCSVLLKPSEVTHDLSNHYSGTRRRARIGGGARIVTGGPETGKAMIEQVDAVVLPVA
ncbi:MAG: hypothetical protein CM15mP74_30230 [Halieaceae bacterium]|nr:MAG: hypothetical protein CM15mP74_30230 [Halieaceae bacterium]